MMGDLRVARPPGHTPGLSVRGQPRSASLEQRIERVQSSASLDCNRAPHLSSASSASAGIATPSAAAPIGIESSTSRRLDAIASNVGRRVPSPSHAARMRPATALGVAVGTCGRPPSTTRSLISSAAARRRVQARGGRVSVAGRCELRWGVCTRPRPAKRREEGEEDAQPLCPSVGVPTQALGLGRGRHTVYIARPTARG
mmetsp:Transcript_55692/g.147746  ORF Transcript_55692/g.147746 Transcript_55692/m.147746 type:complete len:200 (+) Transcript_55692:292-891(+)